MLVYNIYSYANHILLHIRIDALLVYAVQLPLYALCSHPLCTHSSSIVFLPNLGQIHSPLEGEKSLHFIELFVDFIFMYAVCPPLHCDTLSLSFSSNPIVALQK